MVLTIDAAMEWLRSRALFGARPGLDRVERLLQMIGNPEKQVLTIHIAGTNGKGSTVTFLRFILEELGLKVGTFISPYVIHYNEQISINGKYINDETLIRYVEKYQPLVEAMDKESTVSGITEFETVTALALNYFYDEKVDVAIVEVGMGGLLDSTNVICPLLTAITTIGEDHMDFLGETLEEIAFHKAGIIKKTVPIVTGNIRESALTVIKHIAASNQSKIYCFDEDYKIEYLQSDNDWGEQFNFYGTIGELANVKVSLLGKHQSENAAVAIQLLILFCQRQQIKFGIQDLYRGLARAKWPARMERISTDPLVILDGAHNDHAVYRLADNLKSKFSGHTIHILFSALSTKNVEQMIGKLKEVPQVHLYLTTFKYPKAVELTKLEHFTDQRTKVVSKWQDGLKEILGKIPGNDQMLLVTGSLYFVAQVRLLLTCIPSTHMTRPI